MENMNSQRAWEQYTFWFSYHLNHVHFQRGNHTASSKSSWSDCDKCTNALDKTKFEDRTGRFGLRSKHARESAKKVGLYYVFKLYHFYAVSLIYSFMWEKNTKVTCLVLNIRTSIFWHTGLFRF